MNTFDVTTLDCWICPKVTEAQRPASRQRKGKPVIQMDMKGNVIEHHPSAKAAAVKNGLNERLIQKCAKGDKYNHIGGYRWQYQKTA